MTDEVKTATEMMQKITDEAFKSKIIKGYRAAVSDAFVCGAGWLMVDQNGTIKHVALSDVVERAGHIEQNKNKT